MICFRASLDQEIEFLIRFRSDFGNKTVEFFITTAHGIKPWCKLLNYRAMESLLAVRAEVPKSETGVGVDVLVLEIRNEN